MGGLAAYTAVRRGRALEGRSSGHWTELHTDVPERGLDVTHLMDEFRRQVLDEVQELGRRTRDRGLSSERDRCAVGEVRTFKPEADEGEGVRGGGRSLGFSVYIRGYVGLIVVAQEDAFGD